jgi:hypothetical protein
MVSKWGCDVPALHVAFLLPKNAENIRVNVNDREYLDSREPYNDVYAPSKKK